MIIGCLVYSYMYSVKGVNYRIRIVSSILISYIGWEKTTINPESSFTRETFNHVRI